MSRKSTATATANQDVNFPAASYVANQPAFTVIVWFRSPSNSGGSAFANIWSNGGNFPSDCNFQLNTSGAVVVFYRGATATTFNSSASGTGKDDGRWHSIILVRRSATDHQWYLDFVSVATSATDPGTVTPTVHEVLTPNATQNLPAGAMVGRLMCWRRALTLLEATRAAYLGMAASGGPPGVLWCELGFPGIEPDLSGNSNNGTIGANATIGEQSPPRADYYALAPYRRPQLLQVYKSLRYNASLGGQGASGRFFHDRLAG